MSTIKVWHNPRCSKSREAIKIIQETNLELEIVKYLETSPDVATITQTLQMLNISARELMRTKEDIYKELNLKEENDENALIQAMASHPKLIERPILFKDSKALIGRPTSAIKNWLS